MNFCYKLVRKKIPTDNPMGKKKLHMAKAHGQVIHNKRNLDSQ